MSYIDRQINALNARYSGIIDVPAGEVYSLALTEPTTICESIPKRYHASVTFDSDDKKLARFLEDIPAEYRKFFRTSNSKGPLGYTRFSAWESFGVFTVYGPDTLMAELSVRFPKDTEARGARPLLVAVRFV